MNLYALTSLGRIPAIVRLPLVKLLRRRFGSDYVVDAELFRGARVLVIGPARTLEDDLSGIDPADYDYIVKMNNGLDTPVPGWGKDSLRCDVLFHSLTNETRPVTKPMLRQAGVRLLVHRTATRAAFLNTLQTAARFGDCLQVRHIPCETYFALADRLRGASPTTGLVCAQFFLNAAVGEVAIVGFTFFSTGYTPGYDDAVTSDAAARRRVIDKAHHAPDREAALFARIVRQARDEGKLVTLGRNVQKALPDQD